MNSISEAIKGMGARNSELMQGVVISENPLKIQITNDSKLVITNISAIIPRHLTDYETTVDLEQTTCSPIIKAATELEIATDEVNQHAHAVEEFAAYKVKIKVYNALKIGETVHILAVQNGKKYYVLDRV